MTGPSQDLANDELVRILRLFSDTDYSPQRIGDRVIINGCTIRAYPSHNFNSARGLEKCVFIFVDEADYFPHTQIETVMTIVERLEAKSHPYVVLNSTPNLPTGLYADMDKGKHPRFKTLEFSHQVGLGKIYTEYEINEAKKMPTFAREYCCQYGLGEGNIFPYQLVDAIVQEYDLTPGLGEKILIVDSGYGSSKFAILCAEKSDKIYIRDAVEFERPSAAAVVDRIVEMAKTYPIVVVDDSDPGLITALIDRNIQVFDVSFRSKLSEMTITASMFVKEKKVAIHPAFTDLIFQLKSVRFNERGHPDKKELLFDLGDTFLMAMDHFKSSDWGVVDTRRIRVVCKLDEGQIAGLHEADRLGNYQGWAHAIAKEYNLESLDFFVNEKTRELYFYDS